jgi:heme exporter protein A
MIEIRDLRKQFGPLRALRGISLDVADGEFLTLFGPNGAGKTTLLKILATLSKPTSGEVRVQGHLLTSSWTEVRRYIGFVGHHSFLYPELTAEENLRFFARLYQLTDGEQRARHLIERVALTARFHDPVRTYSRGMLQRLAIARALLHDPLILLLDEPHTGLDEASVERLHATLADISAQGRTILMTTHDLTRGLALAHRALIMQAGKVVFSAARSTLSEAEWRRIYLEHVG